MITILVFKTHKRKKERHTFCSFAIQIMHKFSHTSVTDDLAQSDYRNINIQSPDCSKIKILALNNDKYRVLVEGENR